MTDMAILVVVHNHEKYIPALLESCAQLTGLKKYICDAASTDASCAVIKQFISDKEDFYLLEKDILEGFSKNNNDLIRYFNLEDSDLVLINPDCYFNENSFNDFLSVAKNIPGIGVAVPTLCNPDGSIQTSWRRLPSFLDFLKKRFLSNHLVNHYQSSNAKVVSIQWGLGAFMYIDSSLCKDGILLDERYRLYCEDVDICLNAHSKGLKVVGIHTDGIFHALQENSTSIFSVYNYWNLQSAFRLFLKWNVLYFKIKRKISH